jgi:hypothetical protein
MMAFIAPTPGSILARLSKEGEEVQFRIARGPTALLEFAQHVLQLADSLRLAVSLLSLSPARSKFSAALFFVSVISLSEIPLRETGV